MEVRFKLNGKQVSAEVSGDTILLDVLRNLGCYSVKCGCETTNCGLCTVWINGKSRLSCSILAAGIEGQEVTTLEGLKEEAEEFGAFLAQEGAEQCGFCVSWRIRKLRRSKNIYPAICADVQDIWDSFGQSGNIWR